MRVGRTKFVSGNQKACETAFAKKLIFLFLIILPLGMLYLEWEWKAKNDAYIMVRGDTLSVRADEIDKWNTNKLVHVVSSDVAPTTPVYDSDFFYGAPRAFKLHRVTEYCQWREHSSESRDSDGNAVRTFYYTLGWTTTPIISAFFDQPFRHNNPQRDPFPRREFQTQAARVGAFEVPSPLLNRLGGYHPVAYNQESLSTFWNSPASLNGFKPIGNGYFYSAYSDSGMMFAARLMGMVMEGSFDVQLGDLFASCTAGDIRVHFQVIDPTTISVIGKQLNGDGILGLFQTVSSPHEVGIVFGGAYGAQEMFDKDLWDTWVGLMIARVLIAAIWALLVHVYNETNLSWFGFGYFSLSLALGSWILVRLTNVTLAMKSFEQYPILTVVLTAAGVYCAINYHTKQRLAKQQQPPQQQFQQQSFVGGDDSFVATGSK